MPADGEGLRVGLVRGRDRTGLNLADGRCWQGLRGCMRTLSSGAGTLNALPPQLQ
jgi:hypothetical protein